MTIKGLTDRNLSFPQIGNIRKGDRGGKNGAPRELQWFRVEFDEKETERAGKFLHCYGSQPTEINILLPFNEIERTWDAWCEAYTAGRMVARSDGEFFSYLVDMNTGKTLVQNGVNSEGNKVPHREIIGTAGKSVIKCRPVGRLKVVIPELQSLAYLVVHTTSVIDIRNISEQLEAIRQINGGRIAGIPLVLRRRPKKISVPGQDGQKTRMTKHMISIEADPQWVAAMLSKLNQAALPSGYSSPLLPETTATAKEEYYEEVTEDEVIEESWEEIADEPDEPQDNASEPAPEKMSLSYAESQMTGEKTPRRYGDLTTQDLERLQTSIRAKMETVTDIATRESMQLKLDAAELIVKSRNHK